MRVLTLSLLLLCSAPPGVARGASPIVYMALGDSTATGVGAERGGGYPDRLARLLGTSGQPVRLVNLGVSGATAEDVRRSQLPRVMAERPALVTIGIGINDLVRGRPLRDFSRDLHVIADLVHRTKATVVISEIPDISRAPSSAGSPKGLERRVASFNAAIRQVAERHGFAVGQFEATSRRAFEDEALFSSDGFHPSARGYDLWAESLWPALEQALARSREPPERAPAP